MADKNEDYHISNDDLRQQAWDFFQMQASQRLSTFNFYIIISSVLITGLVASFKEELNVPYIGLACGLLLSLFSFIFWKLDERNSWLIKGAEQALKYFESTSQLPDEPQEGVAVKKPHTAKKFLREEFDTCLEKSARSWRLWNNPFSYSECFRSVFFIFGVAGLCGAILAILNMIDDLMFLRWI